MNDTKFTKGPWKRDKRGECLIGSNGNEVVIYNCGLVGGNKTTESVANAHLIAAAPDMYAMIESLSKELQHAIDEVNGSRLMQINNQTETPPDMWDMESLHDAQALLSKARGEQ